MVNITISDFFFNYIKNETDEENLLQAGEFLTYLNDLNVPNLPTVNELYDDFKSRL